MGRSPNFRKPGLDEIHIIGSMEMKITNNMLQLVGNTPLLKLEKVTKGLKVNVLVKLEYLNPSGSYKDRAALYMVEQAERRGELKPDGIIVGASSGNFGPALAFVGAVKGYKVQLAYPEWFLRTQDRINIIRGWGAEILDSPPPQKIMREVSEIEEGLVHFIACIKHCSNLKKSDSKVWLADQMTNPDNPIAHKLSTGREILEQTNGNVDIWVASVGSAGALWGVAQALREKNPNMKVVALQPEDFPIVDWSMNERWDFWIKRVGFEYLEYPKSSVKRMLESGLPDETISVKIEDARNMANRLAAEEGIFCGMSSGANVFAALELAKKLKEGQSVVTVIVDRREKYAGEHPFEHYVV